MGLIPPSEVENIVYFEDVTQTTEDYYNDCSDGERCPIFNSINKTISVLRPEGGDLVSVFFDYLYMVLVTIFILRKEIGGGSENGNFPLLYVLKMSLRRGVDG